MLGLVAGGPQDRLAQPLQAEDQQDGPDHDPKGVERDQVHQGRAEGRHQHGQHGDRGGDPFEGRPPSSADARRDHDGEGLDHLHRAGEEHRDHQDDGAGVDLHVQLGVRRVTAVRVGGGPSGPCPRPAARPAWPGVARRVHVGHQVGEHPGGEALAERRRGRWPARSSWSRSRPRRPPSRPAARAGRPGSRPALVVSLEPAVGRADRWPFDTTTTPSGRCRSGCHPAPGVPATQWRGQVFR